MVATTEKRAADDNPRLVWTGALIVAAIGAYIMYAALPGVNWGIWTAAASVGLALVIRARGRLAGPPLVMLAIATWLAAGSAVTADPIIHALTCLAVMLFLSLAMLLSVAPGPDYLTAFVFVSAPFVAAAHALGESFTRLVDSRMFHSTRARAVLRGAVITIPVVAFFALLLAGADPLFATWRDEIARIISTWSVIPRAIFFSALLVIVLGAYSFAARAPIPPRSSASAVPGGDSGNRWLGATERLILVFGVAALFWLFIGVQLSYLFGNAPALAGSGITFAEYARRGFAELTIVATCSVVLILVTERYGRLNGHTMRLKALTISLLIAVLFILASAFHRVSLYEAAYGYTISRLYAQVYMLVLATALLALAWGVMRTLNTGLLFRSVMTVAVAAFAILVFWNHEAWIASANIDRYSTTGKLDVVYITRDLSPNAIPVVVARLKTLPEPMQSQLKQAVVARYGNGRRLHPDRWFEWNLRRQQARAALASIGLPLATGAPVVVRTPD